MRIILLITSCLLAVYAKTALLIIDVQNDFCPPNGSLAVPGGTEIIPGINSLKSFGNFDLVVYTQDWHPANHVSFAVNHPNASVFTEIRVPKGENSTETILQMLWPVHCVQNSYGAQFYRTLTLPDLKKDVVIRKGTNPYVDGYSAFFDNARISQTPLDGILKAKEISKVVVTGLAFDYCVGSTALDANSLGYETIVLKDLSHAVNQNSSDEMEKKLQNAQVKVIDSQEYLADH
jgi:nicotinamidase/pyrazinamidase